MARRYRFLMSFTSTIHQCLRHWWSQHLRRSHPGKDGFFRAKNAKRCGRYVTFYFNAETSKPVRLWLLACTTAPSPSPQRVWLGEWGHELLQLMPYHRHFPFQGTLLSTLDNIAMLSHSLWWKTACAEPTTVFIERPSFRIIDNDILT